MTRRTDQIGFSQRVRLEWLEQTEGKGGGEDIGGEG